MDSTERVKQMMAKLQQDIDRSILFGVKNDEEYIQLQRKWIEEHEKTIKGLEKKLRWLIAVIGALSAIATIGWIL